MVLAAKTWEERLAEQALLANSKDGRPSLTAEYM